MAWRACQSIHSWLQGDRKNVVVVVSGLGGRERERDRERERERERVNEIYTERESEIKRIRKMNGVQIGTHSIQRTCSIYTHTHSGSHTQAPLSSLPPLSPFSTATLVKAARAASSPATSSSPVR